MNKYKVLCVQHIHVLCVCLIIVFTVLLLEDRDEYDEEFDRMREANLKTRLIQAKDEHTTALKTVDQCRSKLSYAKQQVSLL